MRELIASCALKLLQSHCPFWNNLPARSSILYNQQVMVFLLYDLSDFCDTCTQAFTTKTVLRVRVLFVILRTIYRTIHHKSHSHKWHLYAICELWWIVSLMSCSVILVYKVRGFLLISFCSLVIFIFNVSLFDTFEILLPILAYRSVFFVFYDLSFSLTVSFFIRLALTS